MEDKNIQDSVLWGFGFDHESKQLTVYPPRGEQLIFKNIEELKLFVADLADQIQLWGDLSDAVDSTRAEPQRG
jgi:hypothetical protein